LKSSTSLAPGDEKSLAHGHIKLHRRNARSRRGAREPLHGDFRQAREFEEAIEAGFRRDERIFHVDMPAAEEVLRGRAIDDAAIGEIGGAPPVTRGAVD
jgi:hypothetical protein